MLNLERNALPSPEGVGVFGKVFVRLLPGKAVVPVERAAARHLFHLLQQYNDCLRDPEHYRERWAGFWPNLSLVERKMLVLLVKTNSGGTFGSRLRAIQAPVDFEEVDAAGRRLALDPAVEAEFRRLLTMHYSQLATRRDVLDGWRAAQPKTAAIAQAIGLLEEVLGDAYGLHSDLIARRCYEAFVMRGWPELNAKQMANDMGIELETMLQKREALLC